MTPPDDGDRRGYHTPVMVSEVIALLRPVGVGTIVDATFGGGGHSLALLAACPSAGIVAVDRDPAAARVAAAISAGPNGARFRFVPGNYSDLASTIEQGTDMAAVLFDLGVSSHQLDTPARGFSYHRSGPLDMRMGPDAARSAADVVNHWDEPRLAAAIARYGEERFARRIAAAIVAARPIADTAELAGIVAGAVPAAARRARHPARKTFQAIRIAVNDELLAIEEGVDAAMRLVRSGGRVVVISYHSLEDRIVKRRFAAGTSGCVCPPELPVCACGRAAGYRSLARKPLRPGEDEIAANPRARSARLRAVERIAA